MRGLTRTLAQAVLPAAVLGLAYGVTLELLEGPERPDMGSSERAEEVFAVNAVDVDFGAHRASLRAFGEVEAADSVDLRVISPGEVVDFHPDLDAGKLVEAGSALVTIDPFHYEGAVREARAQLSEAEARLEEIEARIELETTARQRAEEQRDFAVLDLQRAEALARTGTTSDRALDERRLLVSQRAQALEQRQAQLKAERARRRQQLAAVERLTWQLELAERALQDTVLTAPFTGIVSAEQVTVGRMLAASDVAVSLIRAGAYDVRFMLSDQRYGRLVRSGPLIGTPIEVIWRIGDAPLTFDATITRVAADIKSDTGGVEVFARLDLDGEGPEPRPGAFVEVRVPGVLHDPSVRLPAEALNEGGVFVIGADDRLALRQVRVLARDHDEAIVSGDLAAGDQVVVTRLAEAGEGLLVKRVNEVSPPQEAEAAAVADAASEPESGEPAPAEAGGAAGAEGGGAPS